MTNFLSTDEKKASSTFEKYGYFIYQVIDKRSLTKIR